MMFRSLEHDRAGARRQWELLVCDCEPRMEWIEGPPGSDWSAFSHWCMGHAEECVDRPVVQYEPSFSDDRMLN